MENKSHALVAGIFTLLFGVAVLASLFWFGGKKDITVEYVVVTRQNVTGLNPQSQVRYRGISVGKVREILIDPKDPGNILVIIDVKDTVPITQGTVAKLAYQGITGIAHILLEEEGKNRQPIQRNDDGEFPRIAMRQSLFDELGQAGAGTLKQAESFFGNASETLNAENRKHFAGLLINLEKNTAQLSKILADERVQNVGATIARIDSAAERADRFFTDAKTLIPKIDALSGKLETVVGKDASEGAQATLSQINELTAELTATSRQLSRTLRAFEQAPDSILFGAPAPTPGPGEPGFTSANSGKKQ
ncbi:MAG TPA: MlaD family protein [Rhodocyclaceae bacterium]|nr:MlaD family protein [Rhodocyclaceae bacterium]